MVSEVLVLAVVAVPVATDKVVAVAAAVAKIVMLATVLLVLLSITARLWHVPSTSLFFLF